MKKIATAAFLALVVALFFPALPARAADNPIKVDAPAGAPAGDVSLLKETRHSLGLAYEYLLKSQMPDGSWKQDPAITALVLYSMLLSPQYNPEGKSEGAINKALAYLETFIKPDGSIYREQYQSYTTALCLLAFAESNREQYKDVIKKAKDFLIKFQADEGEGYGKEHRYYGGIGYNREERPDLTNTQYALEAVKAAEDYETRLSKVVPGQPQMAKEETELGLHWQKALVFLARCQNLKAVNDLDYATDDGGFIYETGHYKPERSHSYGSMTYAGVKSLLYAKLSKDDIRVKKAVAWIKDHYTWDENPGFGTDALYFYYDTAAKSLDALGEETLVDSKGGEHAWREEYLKKLISLQKEEGKWENENGRFWENIGDLTTAHATIGMKFALHGLLGK